MPRVTEETYPRLAPLLACPVSRTPLAWREGCLVGGAGHTYPVVDGVPRLLPENADAAPDALQVQESFGSKWTRLPEWGMDTRTHAFMRDWLLRKYGWGDEEHYRRSLEGRCAILDAGCGLGREVVNFAAAAPAAQVVGLEYSRCVAETVRHLESLPNAWVVQGDIMRPPLARGGFDLVFSEGVLHHTPDTRAALEALLPLLARNAEIAFYVYARKAPLREFADDYLRERMIGLAPEECWEACRAITALGKALSDLRVEVEIERAIPLLGITAGRYNLQRLIYDHILKCFWNDDFDFEENNLVNFDWYHPAFAHRHTPDEVRNWLEGNGLEIEWMHTEPSGITCRARSRAA